MLGVDRGEPGRHHRAPVAALRAVAVVAEARHQLRPRLRDALHVPARLRRDARPAVARKRRRDDVEVFAERFDHVEELGDRARPAVRDDQRQRVRVVGAGVDEVDLLTVDVGEEVRPTVELRFLRPPVVLVLPRVAEVLEIREIGAVVPTTARDLVGPARAAQPFLEVVEHRFGYVDTEGPDLVARHGRRRYNSTSLDSQAVTIDPFSSFRLDGKVAIVTGASAGFGRALRPCAGRGRRAGGCGGAACGTTRGVGVGVARRARGGVRPVRRRRARSVGRGDARALRTRRRVGEQRGYVDTHSRVRRDHRPVHRDIARESRRAVRARAGMRAGDDRGTRRAARSSTSRRSGDSSASVRSPRRGTRRPRVDWST